MTNSTKTTDLVDDLRALADCDARAGEPLGKCMRRAADEIERLRTENAALIADNATLHEGWTAEVNS